jgi:DNA polymerase III subunit beta
MKITIKSYYIKKMIKIVSNCIKNSKNNDIFSHILVKNINNNFFIISINEELEIATFTNLESKDNKNGEIVIKYNTIYNICKYIDDDNDILIERENKIIKIKHGNNFFKIPISYENIFPSFKIEKNIINIKIKTKKLVELFKYSYSAVAENNPKLSLNGILMDFNKNSINTLSSDGFRLTFSQILFKANIKKFKVIITKNLIKEFLNLEHDENFSIINVSNNYFKIITRHVTLTSKIINDNYEHHLLNLSHINNKNLTINNKDLKTSIKRISAICSVNTIILLSFNKNIIKLNIKNSNEYSETYIENKYTSDEIHIGLNYKYLNDILKLIDNNEIEIIITHMKRHFIIKEKNSNYLYLIMPYKI